LPQAQHKATSPSPKILAATPDNKKNEKKIIDNIISLFNHIGFFSAE